MTRPIEVWKSIKGYEGHYEVSTFGRVRSVDRYVSYKPRGRAKLALRKGQILMAYPNRKIGGYLSVGLWRKNILKTKSVHRAVAETFIPNPFNLPEINHIDCNSINNNVKNLEWCNRHHNYRHSIAHGHSRAKITPTKARCIIKARNAGATYDELAKQFDICATTAHKVVNNRLLLLQEEI